MMNIAKMIENKFENSFSYGEAYSMIFENKGKLLSEDIFSEDFQFSDNSIIRISKDSVKEIKILFG